MKISGILLPEYAAKLTLFNHLTSESEFYRNLREEKLLAHRGKGQAATGPNEVTGLGYCYLQSPVRGWF